MVDAVDGFDGFDGFDDPEWQPPSPDLFQNIGGSDPALDPRHQFNLERGYSQLPETFRRTFDAVMFRRDACPLEDFFGPQLERNLTDLLEDRMESSATRTRAAWLLIESAALPPLPQFEIGVGLAPASDGDLADLARHWHGLSAVSAKERWRRNVQLALSKALGVERVSQFLSAWIADHTGLGSRAEDRSVLVKFVETEIDTNPLRWLRRSLGLAKEDDPTDLRRIAGRLGAAERGSPEEVEARRQERFWLHSLLELTAPGESPGIFRIVASWRGVHRPIPKDLAGRWLGALGLPSPK